MSRYEPFTDNVPMLITPIRNRFLAAELLEKVVFAIIPDATTEIFNYIEMYYNTQRLHSDLNYLTPLQYEERFYESKQEALAICCNMDNSIPVDH